MSNPRNVGGIPPRFAFLRLVVAWLAIYAVLVTIQQVFT